MRKYKVVRFAGKRSEVLLDSQLFTHPVNALSALLASGPDEAWVGSWYGELFHYRDNLYLASGDGLWRWSMQHHDLLPIHEVPTGAVQALSQHEHMLCDGIGKALWCLGHQGWRPHWQAPTVITALHPRSNGGWLLGGRNGYFCLTRNGALAGQDLQGVNITGFVRQSERLWIATWEDGLLSQDGDEWKAFKADSLSAIAIDTDGGLWMAAYDTGLIRMSLQQAAALLE